MTDLTQRSAGNGDGFGAYLAPKVAAFDGAAGSGAVGTVALYTVTGAVLLRLICVCTESLVEAVGGGTVEVGIAGATANLIAQTVSTAVDAGEVWHDNSPDSEIEDISVMAGRVLGNGNDIILTVGAQAVTDGTLAFAAFWTPITAGASVVSA